MSYQALQPNRSKIGRLKKSSLTGVLAGYLGLIGCGGGGGTSTPGPPPNRAPVISSYTVNPNSGTAPLETTHSWDINDPDGDTMTCELDIDNNGTNEYTINNCTSASTQQHTYSNAGNFTSKLIVSDGRGGLVSRTADVTVSQDEIVFWSRRDTNGGFCDDGDVCNEDIYVIGVDADNNGTNERRLTTDPGQDLEPTYSPDGNEILFTSHRTGGTAVWRMDASDGSNQRDITSNIVERARQADWCSNGEVVVAYRDKGDSEAGIGIINPEANTFTPIYSEPKTGSIPEWPRWSPDCSEIAFSKFDGNWDIWKMNSDGSGLMNLTNNPSEDRQPDWFPDGTGIAFFSDRVGTPDLYRMDSNGNTIVQLTSDVGIEVDPVVSPDGDRIAFSHDIDFTEPQIYIMNSDGLGGWTLLTTVAVNRYPSWRPEN